MDTYKLHLTGISFKWFHALPRTYNDKCLGLLFGYGVEHYEGTFVHWDSSELLRLNLYLIY